MVKTSAAVLLLFEKQQHDCNDSKAKNSCGQETIIILTETVSLFRFIAITSYRWA